MHPALSALASHVVAAGQQTMAPGWSIPPRKLPVHDLLGVVSGHGTLVLGEATYPLGPGTWALLPAGVRHKVRQRPGNPLTLRVVHFGVAPMTPPNFLERIAAPGELPCAEPEKAAGLFDWLQRHFHGESDAGQTLANRALDLLLLLLLHGTLDATASDTRLGPAVERMRADYARKWTTSALAREAGLSPDHFRECFQARIGTTPMRYLRDLRLRHAERLLRTTDGTLQEIADATGWENASTFARTFKERTGQTPGTYRALNAMSP